MGETLGPGNAVHSQSAKPAVTAAREMSRAQLFAQVLDDGAVLRLWAKQDDFGISTHANGVAWWPEKQISTDDGLLCSIGVCHGDRPFHHVSPMWGLAEIGLEPFEKGRDVRALLERKVLSGNRPVTGRITKVERLTGNGTWDVDSCGNVVLCDFHGWVRENGFCESLRKTHCNFDISNRNQSDRHCKT